MKTTELCEFRRRFSRNLTLIPATSPNSRPPKHGMDYYVGVFQRFFMLCFTNLQTGICEEKKTQKEKGKKT
jgi:hypothetical protein